MLRHFVYQFLKHCVFSGESLHLKEQPTIVLLTVIHAVSLGHYWHINCCYIIKDKNCYLDLNLMSVLINQKHEKTKWMNIRWPNVGKSFLFDEQAKVDPEHKRKRPNLIKIS